MTKGVIHHRRQLFIKTMIDVNTVAQMVLAYKSAYPVCKKDETARISAYRLLQDNTIVQAIDKLKQEKEEAIKKVKQKEIEKIAREQVASELQLDATLSQIALGRHRRKKKVVVFNPATKTHQTVTVEVEPDETAIIGASNLLYKRKGSFAEKKIRHELGDSFIEAMKKVHQLKKQQQPGDGTGIH